MRLKHFLLTLCIFDSFTLEQAFYMWQKENAEKLLNEITEKNALIKYDISTKTYQMHNIFTNFLKDMLQRKDRSYKQDLHHKAAQWYMRNKEYIAAMHYFYISEDFDGLLEVVELDKG